MKGDYSMRALMVLSFLVAVVAVAFSVMAYGRANTKLDEVLDLKTGVQKVEAKVKTVPDETQMAIQAELGGVKADLNSKIADVTAEVQKLAASTPSEAVIKAQMNESLKAVGQQSMALEKMVKDLQAKVGEKDTKIAELEAKLGEVAATNAQLRSDIGELAKIIKNLLSIMAPAEMKESAPAPEAKPAPAEAAPAQPAEAQPAEAK
jgi:peptidoglycan hydrolase CwlO-like protein